MDCSNISKCANNLVRTYETRDPFVIAKCIGLDYKYMDMQNIKGFYSNILKNRFIVINNNLDEISTKIICAHELGHDRLHRKLPIGMFTDKDCVPIKIAKTEIEANYFNAELLMEDEKFLELATNGYTYYEIASILEVHKELALIKAQILNSKGYNFNLAYIPKANFLAHTKTEQGYL